MESDGLKLVSISDGKIILGIGKDKTQIVSDPIMAIEIDVIDKFGWIDKEWDNLWKGNPQWERYVKAHKRYIKAHKWLSKLDVNYPVGDRIATSELDRKKLELFMEMVDFDDELCGMVWDSKDKARFQLEILEMNISTLVYYAKKK